MNGYPVILAAVIALPLLSGAAGGQTAEEAHKAGPLPRRKLARIIHRNADGGSRGATLGGVCDADD